MARKWYLGVLKDRPRGGHKKNWGVWLEDFRWECDWYWAGGYIGNDQMHCHFDGCFLDIPDQRGHPLGNFVTPWMPKREHENADTRRVIDSGAAVWKDLGFFLNDPQYTPAEWWRIKDLFKQFYALKEAAEVFHYGGHCTSEGRSSGEIVPRMATAINKHIETVIIPQVRLAMNHGELDGA